MCFDFLKYSDEKIVWRGKPEFKLFLILGFVRFFQSIGFLIFAWGIFVLFAKIGGHEIDWTKLYIIAFIVISEGLYRLVKKVLMYKRTAYCITNQGVYFQTGILKSEIRKYKKDEVVRVDIQTNKLERKYNAGTILINIGEEKEIDGKKEKVIYKFESIKNPASVARFF